MNDPNAPVIAIDSFGKQVGILFANEGISVYNLETGG
jgi:hypothetical protein